MGTVLACKRKFHGQLLLGMQALVLDVLGSLAQL